MNTVNSPLTNAFIFRPVVKLVSKAIFALDVFQIEQCDGFVCNLNGRVPDEGAVVEAAMALAWGKPVVFYRSDCRRLYGNGDNPVIAGASSFKTVSEIREIPGELERLPGSFSPALRPEQLPPFVRKVHRFGEAAWKLTQRFRFLRPKNCLVD